MNTLQLIIKHENERLKFYGVLFIIPILLLLLSYYEIHTYKTNFDDITFYVAYFIYNILIFVNMYLIYIRKKNIEEIYNIIK